MRFVLMFVFSWMTLIYYSSLVALCTALRVVYYSRLMYIPTVDTLCSPAVN